MYKLFTVSWFIQGVMQFFHHQDHTAWVKLARFRSSEVIYFPHFFVSFFLSKSLKSDPFSHCQSSIFELSEHRSDKLCNPMFQFEARNFHIKALSTFHYFAPPSTMVAFSLISVQFSGIHSEFLVSEQTAGVWFCVCRTRSSSFCTFLPLWWRLSRPVCVES